VEIALRTQQIIAEESGAADLIDPLGGSYYIEELTDNFVSKSKKYLERIDKIGGMAEAVESGFVQREIQESAYRKQKDIDEKRQTVVGVNKYKSSKKTNIDLLKVDPELESEQIKNLKKIKESRDLEKVKEALSEVKKAAQDNKNLMPVIIEAVKVRASLNEISDQLRDVFGVYKSKGI
jgi:methylmalonyl-CoA mutase N-terminal domain/subunit